MKFDAKKETHGTDLSCAYKEVCRMQQRRMPKSVTSFTIQCQNQKHYLKPQAAFISSAVQLVFHCYQIFRKYCL